VDHHLLRITAIRARCEAIIDCARRDGRTAEAEEGERVLAYIAEVENEIRGKSFSLPNGIMMVGRVDQLRREFFESLPPDLADMIEFVEISDDGSTRFRLATSDPGETDQFDQKLRMAELLFFGPEPIGTA